MRNFLIDFGFTNTKTKVKDYKDIEFGTRKKDKTILWTILIYIFFSSGIFLRHAVNYPNPVDGINPVFTFGIVAASFIIGLGLLAPLLRIISKFHDGKLSWQHCLTAFSIGFFGDLTFALLTKSFINLIN